MAEISSLAIVLECNVDTQAWTSSHVDLLAENVVLPAVCYVFLESGKWYKDSCSRPNRKKILALFHAPNFLSNKTCTDLNGYFGSQSSFVQDKDKDSAPLASCNTWLRILTKKILKKDEIEPGTTKDYLWYEIGIFTDWSEPAASRVLCIGAPRGLRSDLHAMMIDPGVSCIEFGDPFAMLRPLIDELINLCDENTWRVTQSVREIEQHRENRPDFEALRDLARHTGHIVEVQQAAIETLERLVSQQETSFKDLPELTKSYKTQAREYLGFQLQVFKSIRWRAQSTHDRLEEEITLAYNMLASSDNAIMKSITLLTMFFLPGTFISALFSTTFFSFAENGWQFSHSFWIYWTVTIPITLVVVFVWWLWLGGSYTTIRNKWLHDNGGKRLAAAQTSTVGKE